MYSIGEFARMAQVTKRQLRYWDEIGLLQPEKVAASSGHRYYSANQLPALNRIIALKELGLSMDQIRRFIKDDVSVDEMQGMLLMKKVELEQQVLDEMRRIRTIESRLTQIREKGQRVRDVVVKQVPSRMYIGARYQVLDWESTYEVWGNFLRVLPQPNDDVYGDFMGILHADGVATDFFDMEVGRILHTDSHTPSVTNDGKSLVMRELPATTMATFVHQGPPYEAHIGYSAIGEWVEMNDYVFAGPMHGFIRKINSLETFATSDLIVEMQFPIVKRASDYNLLNANNS